MMYFQSLLAPNDEYPTWKRKAPMPNFTSIKEWLKHYSLSKYEESLIKNGFDHIDFIGEDIIDENDLETLGISDTQHKKEFTEALRKKGFSKGKYQI